MAEKLNENVVFVSNKPEKHAKDYAFAILTQLAKHNEVIVKGRGKAISRVFDATEIVGNILAKGIEYKKITPSTEQIETDDKERPMRVTAIEVVLIKK